MGLAKHSFNFSAQTQLSSIDLQHLRFAVAADDHGSFRQAAEAMAVRQSTLSSHLGLAAVAAVICPEIHLVTSQLVSACVLKYECVDVPLLDPRRRLRTRYS